MSESSVYLLIISEVPVTAQNLLEYSKLIVLLSGGGAVTISSLYAFKVKSNH